MTAAKETAEQKMNGYKRLGFVSDYSTFAWSKSTGIASGVYGYSKGFVPKSLNPTVDFWEKKVSEIGSPVLAKLHDNSDYVLHAVDDTVGLRRLLDLLIYVALFIVPLIARWGQAIPRSQGLGVDEGVPEVLKATPKAGAFSSSC